MINTMVYCAGDGFRFCVEKLPQSAIKNEPIGLIQFGKVDG